MKGDPSYWEGVAEDLQWQLECLVAENDRLSGENARQAAEIEELKLLLETKNDV